MGDTNFTGSSWESNRLEVVTGSWENVDMASWPCDIWGAGERAASTKSSFYSGNLPLETRGVRPISGQRGRKNVP